MSAGPPGPRTGVPRLTADGGDGSASTRRSHGRRARVGNPNYVEVDMTETRKEHEGTAVEAGSLATQRFAESGKLSGLG